MKWGKRTKGDMVAAHSEGEREEKAADLYIHEAAGLAVRETAKQWQKRKLKRKLKRKPKRKLKRRMSEATTRESGRADRQPDRWECEGLPVDRG